MQKIKQVGGMEDNYLLGEELEELILGLSSADILKLKKIAWKYTGNHDMDAEDLLQEAIVRTLFGNRKTCPRNVPIVTFVAGAMKSIASGEREKYQRMDRLEKDEWDAIEDLESSPENDLMDSQAYKELENLFENDEEILLLILYLQDGASPSEIQKSEGWSDTQYNTIRRRMRRKWNSHTEQELKS